MSDPSPPPSAFDALHEAITAALLSTTRATTALCAEDLRFHRSLDADVAAQLDAQQRRILTLAERLLASAARGTGVAAPPRLEDVDALEAGWGAVVDVLDGELERADVALDGMAGVVRKGVEPAGQVEEPARGGRVPRNLDIPKPQLLFEDAPDNGAAEPFKPLLTTKPHAVVPLEESLSRTEMNGYGNLEYEHPYKEEIESYTYPEDMYTVREPASYTALEESTATFVDTEEALDEMLRELKQARVIAIDLEHHDLRSYAGIVCLMQISTRDRDWIVDTLRPWRRRLQKLNEVFADPGIVKVLHGAQWDVIWLQRDFGLYLVGLFDTYHASRALRLQAGNLAFLLKKYCGFDAQKQYQLADWRQRPLPQPLLDYARSDTHFLLYIYDCLCNELVEGSTPAQDGDLVANVLRNSKDTALARHRAEPYDARFGLGPHGWYRALARHPALFTRQQFATFRALHAWRDAVAREDDDSPTLVLSQHALFAMAREPPATRAAVLRLSAAPVTSAAVRSRAGEIVAVVERAVAGAEEGGDMLVAMRESRERERALRARAAGQEEDEGPAAAVAAGKNDAPADVPLARPGAARLLSSVFWGALLTRPQRRGFSSSPEAAATAAVRLALPLPALTAEVFAPAERADEGPAADGAAPAAAPRFVPQDQRCGDDFAEGLDDVFVVRQLGENRRKRARAEAAVHERDDGGGLAPVDEAEAARRAERRAARKAARREKKASTAADVEAAADEEEQAEEGAFDYEAAPSLVKGGAAGEDGVGGGFGVYKRAMDAPRGLPKRKERLGKSKTFGR